MIYGGDDVGGECVYDTLMPGGNDTGVCTTKKHVEEISKFVEKNGVRTSGMSPRSILDKAKKLLGVTRERDLWLNQKFQSFISNGELLRNIDKYFKPPGPANSTKLLNNINIDQTLENWTNIINGSFDPGVLKLTQGGGSNNDPKFAKWKKVKHIGFQMIDFASKLNLLGNDLRDIDIPGLVADGYKCFVVVMNTDISLGTGKHWFCLFGDLSGKGTRDSPYVIEFFNSSGNGPRREIIEWYNSLRNSFPGVHIELKLVNEGRQLQFSRTECGLWALNYIKHRLLGNSPESFVTSGITDEKMTSSRAVLFRGGNELIIV